MLFYNQAVTPADKTTPGIVETTIVVFEQRPRWGPELKRQFLKEPVRVFECRATADILPRFGIRTHGVVVIDVDAVAADCLQFLGRRPDDSPLPPVVGIGSPRFAELEWPLLEAGATAFVLNSIDGEDLARLCRRQWTNE